MFQQHTRVMLWKYSVRGKVHEKYNNRSRILSIHTVSPVYNIHIAYSKYTGEEEKDDIHCFILYDSSAFYFFSVPWARTQKYVYVSLYEYNIFIYFIRLPFAIQHVRRYNTHRHTQDIRKTMSIKANYLWNRIRYARQPEM